MECRFIIIFLFIFSKSFSQSMQHIQTKAYINGIVHKIDAVKVGLDKLSFKVVSGKFYGGQEPLVVFSPDSNGNFMISLPKGDYTIVEESRPNVFTTKRSTKTKKWDNRCLRRKWKQPLAQINIKTLTEQQLSFVASSYTVESVQCSSVQ